MKQDDTIYEKLKVSSSLAGWIAAGILFFFVLLKISAPFRSYNYASWAWTWSRAIEVAGSFWLLFPAGGFAGLAFLRAKRSRFVSGVLLLLTFCIAFGVGFSAYEQW